MQLFTPRFKIWLNPEGNRDTEATDVSIHSVTAQGKQEDVEANDGWEKNEEKEKVCCNYGSVWSNGCYLSAERRVEGDSGTRRGGTVAWKASGKQIAYKISGMTRATFNYVWFLFLITISTQL